MTIDAMTQILLNNYKAAKGRCEDASLILADAINDYRLHLETNPEEPLSMEEAERGLIMLCLHDSYN